MRARGELAKLIESVVEKQAFFKIDGKKLKRTLERRQVGYCGTGLTIARLTADIDGKGECAIFGRHETNPPRAVSAQVPVKGKQPDVTVSVQQ